MTNPTPNSTMNVPNPFRLRVVFIVLYQSKAGHQPCGVPHHTISMLSDHLSSTKAAITIMAAITHSIITHSIRRGSPMTEKRADDSYEKLKDRWEAVNKA
jgi:hypothetical protein